MELNKITNLDFIKMAENATELFRLGKYRDKEYVEAFIGLTTARAGFYGVLKDNKCTFLRRSETNFNSDDEILLVIEGIVVLDYEPFNQGLGNITYIGYGLLEVNGLVIYDGRGGTGNGGGAVYTGPAPSNIAVGAAPSGTDFTGMNFNEFVEAVTIAYLTPSFSSFSITGQTNPVEVGTALSGNKTFTWGTLNPSNIELNSIQISNVNTSTILGATLENDGNEVLSIGSIDTSFPFSQIFRITGLNTNNQNFTRDYTIPVIFPYFYGKVSAPGAAGTNRPTINQALIDSGTKVVASSTGTITIPFNSTSDDYIWFAVPTGSPVKTVWYVNPLNNGLIGGTIGVGGNLFPNKQVLSVTTINWNGINFDVYLSNYQTELVSCDIKNN